MLRVLRLLSSCVFEENDTEKRKDDQAVWSKITAVTAENESAGNDRTQEQGNGAYNCTDSKQNCDK